jgi:hypothetical protein
VPANPFTGEPSHPGDVIWETICKDFTSDFDGWDIDPRTPDEPPYYYAVPEACFKYEQDLQKFFKQKPGGNIYWLSIAAIYPPGVDVEYPWGWKTRKRDPKSLAPDDAVRIFDPTAPTVGSSYADGTPIYWPGPDDSWDLAFELTTKKIPPKKPVPHLKWSQPPIEIDPNSTEPVYSGWDEPSFREWIEPLWFDCWNCPTQCHGDADCDGYVGLLDSQIVQAALGTTYPDPAYNPCADFDRNLTVDLMDVMILQQNINTNPDPNCDPRPQFWQIVADDFRCLGSMPITSIHWWGSYFGLVEPGATPPELPIAWRIGFWSNGSLKCLQTRSKSKRSVQISTITIIQTTLPISILCTSDQTTSSGSITSLRKLKIVFSGSALRLFTTPVRLLIRYIPGVGRPAHGIGWMML